MNYSENIDVVNEVKNQLKGLDKSKGLTTGKVRNISTKYFKLIEDKRIDNVLRLCEELLDERRWDLGVIAYDWAYRVKKQYTKETFIIFEKWLKKYVTGWGDCDDFCTHAFGELLGQYNDLFKNVIEWTTHPDFWVRRASAVILIYPIKKDKLGDINPFIITDKLMNDEHHLVLKGYGWMLKVLSEVNQEAVYNYLLKNKSFMPRVSFRYAMEKFDKDNKDILMSK